MVFFLSQLLALFNLHTPAVFTYVSTRMALAAITSLLLSIFAGPPFIAKLYEWKFGQPIRSDHCARLGELHEGKRNTPTMGGLLILSSMLLSMLLWMEWSSANTLILLVATVWLGGIGAYDDLLKLRHRNPKGLSMRKKLVAQGSFALLLALYLIWPTFADHLQVGSWFAPAEGRDPSGDWLTLSETMRRLYLPFFKQPLLLTTSLGALFSIFMTLFVVVGASNAVNLTDGLDGLAAGCLLLVAAPLALVAFLSNNLELSSYLNILYIRGSGEVAVYLAALAGGTLGFLWYNGYPAQLFMGDTGSLALGGVVGVSAVLIKKELLLGILGGIFVAEALSVILQVASFRSTGRRIFRIAPLHHHFEYAGWPETKVVLRFWIIGLLLAIFGLASLKFQ